jgi:hypothetical protein
MAWDDDDAPDRRTSTVSRNHVPLVPFLLIAFGAAALLHEIAGHGVSVFPLAIGIYLLARSRASEGGHYPLTVIGAVLTGSGGGHLLGDLAFGGAADAIGTLGTAAGFFWLFSTDRRRSSWAIVPAAIVGLIGVGQLGFHISDVANGGSGGWLLPAGVVVAGILLLGAHRLPGPIRLAGLVFVGAAGLSLATNSGDHPQHRRVIPTVPSRTDERSLPKLGDRKLSVAIGSGTVHVVEGDQLTARGRHLGVSESASAVTVTAQQSADLTLTVPDATKLQIKTGSGDVDIDIVSAALDIQTGSGDITVTKPAGGLDLVTGEGDVEASLGQLGHDTVARITTGSGDVELALTGDPTVTASASSGSVSADGFGDGDARTDHSFAHNGDDGTLTVTTGSGDVELTRAEAR